MSELFWASGPSVSVVLLLALLALLAWLAFTPPASRLGFALRVAFVGSCLFFFQRAGAGWAQLSAHLPMVLWALFAVATLVRSARSATLPPWPPKRPLPLAAAALHTGLIALFVALALPLGAAREPAEEAWDLVFPLTEGSFYVLHGGDSPLLNPHQALRAQRHALDLVAVDGLGRRAMGLSPARREAYVVFGAAVVSPCKGVVTGARDDLKDLEPPATDPDNPLGNHLLLLCNDEVTVVLAHLKEGSLSVKVGQRVKGGQPVGVVGNTGDTSEPRLHIHAVRGDVRDPARVAGDEEEGVPMRFGGRLFVRNDLVRVRDPQAKRPKR